MVKDPFTGKEDSILLILLILSKTPFPHWLRLRLAMLSVFSVLSVVRMESEFERAAALNAHSSRQ